MTKPKTSVSEPEGLSARAVELWRYEKKRSTSAGRRVLLEECCRQLDRVDQIRQAAAAAPLFTVTERTGVPHLNPLLGAEKDARTLFAKLAKELGLEWRQDVDGG